jgi:hypothetical protein
MIVSCHVQQKKGNAYKLKQEHLENLNVDVAEYYNVSS